MEQHDLETQEPSLPETTLASTYPVKSFVKDTFKIFGYSTVELLAGYTVYKITGEPLAIAAALTGVVFNSAVEKVNSAKAHLAKLRDQEQKMRDRFSR
jgi:hypothetical protein